MRLAEHHAAHLFDRRADGILTPCLCSVWLRMTAGSLRQQRIAPLLDHERLHDPLKDERIFSRKGLRRLSRLENGHVSPIRKWSYAQDSALRDECVYDRLVARVYRHDRIPARARRLPDNDGFHEIPPALIVGRALPLSLSRMAGSSGTRGAPRLDISHPPPCARCAQRWRSPAAGSGSDAGADAGNGRLQAGVRRPKTCAHSCHCDADWPCVTRPRLDDHRPPGLNTPSALAAVRATTS